MKQNIINNKIIKKFANKKSKNKPNPRQIDKNKDKETITTLTNKIGNSSKKNSNKKNTIKTKNDLLKNIKIKSIKNRPYSSQPKIKKIADLNTKLKNLKNKPSILVNKNKNKKNYFNNSLNKLLNISDSKSTKTNYDNNISKKSEIKYNLKTEIPRKSNTNRLKDLKDITNRNLSKSKSNSIILAKKEKLKIRNQLSADKLNKINKFNKNNKINSLSGINIIKNKQKEINHKNKGFLNKGINHKKKYDNKDMNIKKKKSEANTINKKPKIADIIEINSIKKVSKNKGFINNIKKIPKPQNNNKGLNNINAKKPKSKEINNIKKNTKDKENINNKKFFKNKSKSINLINKKGVNNKKVKNAIPLNIKNKSEKNFNTKSKHNNYQNNIIIEINNNKKLEKIYNNNTDERIVNIQKNLLESMPKKECELCHKQIYSHLYKIHYNTHATEIFNWLYLGTFENACDIEELKRIKATHILNCAFECINKNLASNIKELHLKIHDYKDFQLFDFFEKGNDFINKCKNEGGVILVHCKYGISRSVSIIISYLIKYMGYSTDDAFDLVRKKRGQINPNEGFREQLYSYESHIKGEKEDKFNKK